MQPSVSRNRCRDRIDGVLWLRGLVFTLLVPGVIAGWAPQQLVTGRLQAGWWRVGWLLVFAGSAMYLLCLLDFLAAKGTPAIFFTRHLKGVLGAEPPKLVHRGLYRFSRNPMYVGVVAAVFGQALLYASWTLAIYAVTLVLAFHLVIVFLEEPHLRAREGPAFEQYCRQVPRWIGVPKRV